MTGIWIISTTFSYRLLPQEDRLGGGIIPDLHLQQLADGADRKVVGLAAGFVGVEDGAGDFLAVGGGDVLARCDFLRSVQGHIGKVIAHRAGGGQGGGEAGAQGQSRGAPLSLFVLTGFGRIPAAERPLTSAWDSPLSLLQPGAITSPITKEPPEPERATQKDCLDYGEAVLL